MRLCVFTLFWTITALLILPAQAELLLHEPFDYEPGDLDGQTGGIGFGDSWLVSDNEYIQVVEQTPMTYTMPGGGTIDGGNRSLRFANESDLVFENDSAILSRELETSLEQDSIYFSYLYRYEEGEIDDNDFVIWWFNDADGPNIGLKGNLGNGSGPEDLMARMRNFGPQIAYDDLDISEDEGNIGETIFIVGHLHRADNSDDPDDYDQYDLWVNPSNSEKDDPHASSFADPEDAYLIDVHTLGMRAFSQEPDDAMSWDELRIGTTWEDVVAPLGGQTLPGDFDADGDLDVSDINRLTVESASSNNNPDFDLNADGSVDGTDVREWVVTLAKTWIGDANVDGEFNSGDFVQVFQGGKFEQDQVANWSEGDWDGDGRFSSSDFVAAFQDGGFELGPRPVATVPEPSSYVLLIVGIAVFSSRRCTGPKK